MIHDYVSCFNTSILEVRNLDQSVVITVLMDGLLKNDLKRLLIKSFPQDYARMLDRAIKYSNLEEAFANDIPTNSAVARSNKECS